MFLMAFGVQEMAVEYSENLYIVKISSMHGFDSGLIRCDPHKRGKERLSHSHEAQSQTSCLLITRLQSSASII